MKNGIWQKNIPREGDNPMQKKKRARRLLSSLLLLAVICSALLGCSGDNHAESSGSKGVTTTPESAAQYTTQKVVVHKVADSVRAIGTVQAYQEVEISAEISGRIKKILLAVGDYVKRGDLLVQIDDETRQIALTQKKALLKKAEATRKKALKDAQKGGSLFKQGVISDSESDDIELGKQIADAELDLARADVMKAEKELRDTKIVAPFDGTVALEDVEIGKMVTPGQNLLTLIDISQVKIVVTVSELDITKLSVGSRVEIVIDSLPGKPFTGTVATVGLKADDATRTYPVEIIVANEGAMLLPGMVSRVTIATKEPKEVIMIPKSAARSVKGQMVIYVMHRGKVEQRRVYLGQEHGEQVIVEKGLEAGDMLVVSGGLDRNGTLK
jgi:membrane fusion protein (multidrug efflux system)